MFSTGTRGSSGVGSSWRMTRGIAGRRTSGCHYWLTKFVNFCTRTVVYLLIIAKQFEVAEGTVRNHPWWSEHALSCSMKIGGRGALMTAVRWLSGSLQIQVSLSLWSPVMWTGSTVMTKRQWPVEMFALPKTQEGQEKEVHWEVDDYPILWQQKHHLHPPGPPWSDSQQRVWGSSEILFGTCTWTMPSCNKTILVTNYLAVMGIKTVPHPPYSPDLNPHYFCIFNFFSIYKII